MVNAVEIYTPGGVSASAVVQDLIILIVTTEQFVFLQFSFIYVTESFPRLWKRALNY